MLTNIDVNRSFSSQVSNVWYLIKLLQVLITN